MSRAALAAAVRPFAPGGKLTAAHIAPLNALADALGLAIDEAPRFDPAPFYQALRPALFPALTQAKVAALDVLLAAVAPLPLAHAAYVLATAFHETGGAMVPNVESLNYSPKGLIGNFKRDRISVADANRYGRTAAHAADQVAIGNILYGGAFGRAELGNTQPGDGYKYRGRGYPHHTGRGGYAKVDAELGLGGALLADPDLLLRVDVAVPALVRGMVGGWFTGRSLGDCLPASGAATLAAFTVARAIVNGADRAVQIAEYAMLFQKALVAGGKR